MSDEQPAESNGHADEAVVEETRPERLAQPIDGELSPRLPFAVAGVGASAGGLEAYTEFLQATRPDSGIAFVLIQHLSPKHESVMAELLSHHTKMPVLQVSDGMEVLPNHVYMIRPGFTMTIKDGHLHLGESAALAGHRRPVDDFFKSLAEEQRERAIAVILSGTGSNGTAGAAAIKAVGGMCIAQDPDSCRFASMPRSMIDSGLADTVLKPAEMFEAIVAYATHPYAAGEDKSPASVARQDKLALTEVLAVLRARVRHDFSGYKKPTIVRRIQRRMSLLQTARMIDYVRTLRQSPAEVHALSDDLMIHVTGFFRDPEVWETLRQKVILPMVRERSEDAPIRCWVTACSSGEEAYTLGMLLLEAAEAAGKHFDIKIFATDTAERSLSQARAGIFPGGIESDITPERLERFFYKDDAFYHVKKELRELVVFAPQNVLQDPPFSRLDLCTCRNLLIYIEPDVQRRVLQMLHFGLRENGTMLLGNSETITGAEDLFEPIDKRARIYRRVGSTRHGMIDFPIARSLRAAPNGTDGEPVTRLLPSGTVAQMTNRLLLEQFTPAAVVIDREGRIVYYHGRTERFLEQPRGEPTRDIMTLVREDIRSTLRNAINRAFSESAEVHHAEGKLGRGEDRTRVSITVSPLDPKLSAVHFLVSFEEHDDPPPPVLVAANGEMNGQLTEELRRTRDELQSTIEELQTSNEEMKASHEEITSINEELQSSNEELETSKEELQSLNEELTTVNAQLVAKMEELERTTNDLASLLSSTDIAVVFLDTQFRIRRFTPAVRDLMDLIPADVGRPISDLARKFIDPELAADTAGVLERLVPIEREVVSDSDRWYLRRVLPYRTADNRISGLVITFVDITQRRAAMRSATKAEDRLRQNAEASGVGDWEVELPSRRMYWSDRARELLGVPTGVYATFDLHQSAIHPDDRHGVEECLRCATEPTSDGLFHCEFRVVRPDGRILWLESRGRAEFDGDAGARQAVRVRGTLHDVTDRKTAESKITDALQREQAANNTKDQFLANASHELRTPLSAILLWSSLLQADNCDPKVLAEGLASIESSAKAQQKLIEDLLDSARISEGRIKLDLRPTNLTKIVASAVDMLRPAAAAKDVALATDFGTDIGHAMADPERLQQVVWNLVSNAVKFTPAGGRVNVGLWRRGATIEIRIDDTGQGIEAGLLDSIFGRYSQADPSPTRRHGGLGLGLAISRQLVELHGGRIEVASAGLDQGSTFTVMLPLPASRDKSSAAPEPPAKALSLDGVRVLLVEDDVKTRDGLTRVLARAGARVEAVGHVEDALKALARERPTLIVSDLGLPDRDGHSLIRQVRAEEAPGERLPAIALSAFDRPQDQTRAIDSGFDTYLSKPVDPKRLISVLSGMVRRP
ncbi:MAG TPA: chemotaxis protein CheB [Tepidisphaeraceae bacterium]|jgi:two-component system CheB/CheR fusion protein